VSRRPDHETGQVVSRDGTTIGYRRLGAGPVLLLLHGGALSSQHYLRLAAALAGEFTVVLPDRRGRGLSGPFPPGYSIRTEDEDLAALVAATGARYAFGPADGGLFALHASMSLPELERIAVYEPVLFAGQPGQAEFEQVIDRYSARIEAGDVVGAAIGLTKDADLARVVGAIPDAVFRPLFRLALWLDARRVRPGDTSLRQLIPTLRPELVEVRATEGTVDDYRRVTAHVLLMRASEAPPLMTGSLDALRRVLPHSDLLVLPGLRHGSAQDQGSPAPIAAALRAFFR
jgi:pimeloyl-ACP methyl ester carboxylesterase